MINNKKKVKKRFGDDAVPLSSFSLSTLMITCSLHACLFTCFELTIFIFDIAKYFI